VVKSSQARALAGVIESSQPVRPQREVPVASFHMRTRALEHLRERGCLCFEVVLLHHTQSLSEKVTRWLRAASPFMRYKYAGATLRVVPSCPVKASRRVGIPLMTHVPLDFTLWDALDHLVTSHLET